MRFLGILDIIYSYFEHRVLNKVWSLETRTISSTQFIIWFLTSANLLPGFHAFQIKFFILKYCLSPKLFVKIDESYYGISITNELRFSNLLLSSVMQLAISKSIIIMLYLWGTSKWNIWTYTKQNTRASYFLHITHKNVQS